MNTAQVEARLISLGYHFKKSHDHITEKSVWTMEDDDSIPIVSGHFLGDVIFKAAVAVGELR